MSSSPPNHEKNKDKPTFPDTYPFNDPAKRTAEISSLTTEQEHKKPRNDEHTSLEPDRQHNHSKFEVGESSAKPWPLPHYSDFLEDPAISLTSHYTRHLRTNIRSIQGDGSNQTLEGRIQRLADIQCEEVTAIDHMEQRIARLEDQVTAQGLQLSEERQQQTATTERINALEQRVIAAEEQADAAAALALIYSILFDVWAR